jgi:hypothetical protein
MLYLAGGACSWRRTATARRRSRHRCRVGSRDVPLERRLNETIDLALPIVGALKIDRQALVRRALTIRHYRMHYPVTAARSAWIDGATSSDPLAPMDPRRPFGSPVDSE